MDILLKNVRLNDGESLKDVAIEDGRITAIEENMTAIAERVIDADGRVLIPGFIESHLHLDKALIADRKPNNSGTLKEAISVTAELKPTFTKEDIYDRAKRTLDMIIPNGVTAIRTHSEFDPAQGFTGFEIVLKLKEEYKNLVDIQVVAFPQEGIIKSPGTEEMMNQAMEMGADVVGGIPYNDSDAEKHIDIVFKIAKKYNKPVDIHAEFSDEATDMSIEYLCKKTIAEGYQGKVSVGHLTALHALPKAELDPIIAKMAEAGISVMALTATDLHLGARNDEYNVRRAVTPIRKLRDGGVNMCIATNNIRNAFTPYGNGDILQTAMLTIPVGHLGGANDLKTVLPMITENPAKAIGLVDYGIAVGNKADVVLLDTKIKGNAIIDIPTRLFVIKNGKVTVESTKETIIHR
ncbi:cytosine deaminase [Carnobacterium iners]|uniref:Cytosine deaminase n=1 Tax=Carnobacterium iners TaxID=1073423 RepID=A0A1X7NAT6_9LACT|nr:amidohydrolase family protein [Carnobacterium iners]SEK52292.1 cytosine deaminase [Carnobacterium iners]SMH34724.1 cytosine deaminase [Carnobacterium iners]